jgi:catechol 2,3-dioxygenase-like lactoylglutathione lyase family enzyme
MKQSIIHIALVVRDYDEAIEFFTRKLRFTLVEDTYQPEQNKRWVVVTPPGSTGTTLLLARASTPEQTEFIGNQTGGRVRDQRSQERRNRARPHLRDHIFARTYSSQILAHRVRTWLTVKVTSSKTSYLSLTGGFPLCCDASARNSVVE